MENLLWSLLGYVIFPFWLVMGLLDYLLHQRTSISTTAGLPESRLHLLQTVQVAIPVLIVLFIEINLLALALLVAAAVAHTFTAYWDLRYASQHRVILPLEQMVHAFLFTLPVFATVLLIIMHWPAAHTPTGLLSPGAGVWGLQLRDPPWDRGLVIVILLASFLFGMLPGLAEWWPTRQAEK